MKCSSCRGTGVIVVGPGAAGSAVVACGSCGGRRFTKAEVAAAKRQGYIHGPDDALAGPLFWASGDYYPNEIRRAAEDFALLAAAVEREWEAPDA